jgi:hypothetical protein
MKSYLGDIEGISVEGNWTNGTFIPKEASEQLTDFFEYMVDEDKGFEEPPFSENLLNENNWYIIDEKGQKIGIDIPAVYADGFITWRWR